MESQITTTETLVPRITDRSPSVVTPSRRDRVTPSRLFWPCLLPALASGALLWLCYFPGPALIISVLKELSHLPVTRDWLAWLAQVCSWPVWETLIPLVRACLAWVALVPLLCLVRTRDSEEETAYQARRLPAVLALIFRPLAFILRQRLFLCAWAAGLVFFVPALQWMRVAHPMMYFTWVGLALYCSLFVPVAICLVRWLERRTPLPLVVTLPVVWTALEFFRAHFGTGFPWYFLAHTQHALLPVIQVSDLAGAYAVTFLLAAVNALLFELLYTRRWFRNLFNLADEPPRSRYALPLQFAGVKLLLASVLAYGGWRLRQNDFAAGPRVALIQGNLEQAVRNDRDHPDGGAAAKKSMVRHYRDLSDQAALQQPDLIVWPETSYPDDWLVTPDGQPHKESLELARIVADRWHTEVLLGLNVRALRVEQPSLRYNSAVLIQADGGVGERYDKIHRVPFGEYVPFKDWLPLMEQFAPYDFDYSVAQGEHLTRFRLGKYRFGVLICYEDSDPYLARQYARADSDGPAVDFLLNISNDGWFDGTSEHEEHLAICRFRAVECRRSVARAVNMGISAVIDGNGRVVALPAASWTQSKSIEAVLTAEIPLDRRTSLYAHWGDWLPWGCWLVLALGVGWGLVRKKPLPMAT